MFDFIAEAHRLRECRQPFALATVVRAEKPTSAKPGAKAIVTADGTLTGWVGGSCAQPTVIREALKALQDGQPRLLRLAPPARLGRAPQEGVAEITLTCASGGTLDIYIEPHLPPPHLIAIGHLPIVAALTELGKGLGYTVTVMGPDISPDQFPQADRVMDRLDFSQIAVTPQTYVVVASHGSYDEEALVAALNTGAPYVALVASRTRAGAAMEYLRQSGVSEEQLARLKYPAGLDFGAVEPEEIALSILAEVIQFRRRTPPRAATPTPPPAQARDPVCGMMVEIATVRYTVPYDGRRYYFCSAGCKHSFEKEPENYRVAKEA